MEEMNSGRYYSPDHGQLCQVIEAQTLWGETTCRVRLPAAHLRLEAVRAGFKKAWQERDYATIITVARKRLPRRPNSLVLM